MGLPATVPDWASDTNFSSGAESGNATKASPGAGPLAQGFVPGELFKAQRVNYTLYWIIQHVLYLRNLGTDAFFLAIAFVWTSLHRFTAGIRAAGIQLESGDILYTNSAGVAAPISRTKQLPLNIMNGTGTGGWRVASATGQAFSQDPLSGVSDGIIYIDLPTGATIVGYAVGCTPVGSGTMTVTCQMEDINTSSGAITISPIGSTRTSVGTAYQQLFETSLVDADGAVANVGRRYRLLITSDVVGHQIQFASVSFTDVGFKGNN
jgi:hypothetical protein